jgi:basic amino acid/polyamine antiporter, APA family
MANDVRRRAGEGALVRALGVRALSANTINVLIGGGIFVVPALAAAEMGSKAPLAYLVCALAMGLVVLCFAEAGSRVSLTGGPYAYVEVAFGPFAGFLSGVLLWTLSSFAAAAVASAFAGALAAFWAPLAQPVPRAILLATVFATLAAVNVRGVRAGTRLVEVVTIAKLVPLLLLVVAALFATPAAPSSPSSGTAGLGRTAIILVFAFAGTEAALVPSGEVRDPARTVPRALLIALAGVTLLYIAVQLAAQRTLGVVALAAATERPLVAAAARLAGTVGASVVGLGMAISMFGNVSGMMLAIPRALYAFGRDGFLPAAVGAVHPHYRTPYVAIVLEAVIIATIAITGSFAKLAILANVSVLVLYLLCCAAAFELRRRDVRAEGVPFRVPGGSVTPFLAAAVLLWLLSQATVREYAVVGGVLAAAALVFALTVSRRRTLAPSPES